MATHHDPEGIESKHLHRFADLADAHVLEIGCGDGRLTWRYAAAAKRVTATDPDPSRLSTARRECPSSLHSRLSLVQLKAETLPFSTATFDRAILAWSL